MLFCLATLFCACGGRVIVEGGGQGTSGGTTGAGGADTAGNGATGGFTTAVGVTAVTGAGTTGGAVSSSSGGLPGAATCDLYCKYLESACNKPGLSQYYDFDDCEKVCATFPQGQIGDMTGNSLECRAYHAGAANVTGSTIHCAHAGPTGGDLDPADSMGGPCGDGCEAFCNLALKVCPDTFQDQQDCRLECKKFGTSPLPYSTQDTTGNTLSCRMYHLSVAARDAQSALVHCPHIVLQSPVCK